MPHGGGEIDGPRCGPAPRPWDIPADPSDLFRSEMKVLQVPHTASVKTCHRCRGAGSLLCQECHGKGWVSGEEKQGFVPPTFLFLFHSIYLSLLPTLFFFLFLFFLDISRFPLMSFVFVFLVSL
jgi:hypothetical protein